MRILRNLILVLTVIWLGGCAVSSVAVRSDYDRQANFREYTTYAIVTDKNKSNDPVLGSELNQKRMAQALDAEMKARGYTPVPADENPDLLLGFQTDAKDKQYTYNNNTWGYWRWYGTGPQTRQYQEDRIILNMVDANTKELVWQGWAVGQINERKKDRDAAFREAIYKIMQEYPHRAGGQISRGPVTK